MTVKSVIQWPDDRLEELSEPYVLSVANEQETGQLATDLAETMMAGGGVGISAPQIGILKRVFCIRSNPIRVFFNPEVLSYSIEQDTLTEGCMSAPGLEAKVKRPKTVTIKYQNPDGTQETSTFNGLTARVVQHEIDHLDGILFWERSHPIHRERGLKKWRLFQRKLKRAKTERS